VHFARYHLAFVAAAAAVVVLATGSVARELGTEALPDVDEGAERPALIERMVPGKDGLSGRATLGKSIFFDATLSALKNQSCAFCHAPETGFTSPREDFNKTGSVVEGSIAGRFGNSKPPSATYMTAARS
jgi:cytochrome c peroxidase